jgi:hypothetical protein
VSAIPVTQAMKGKLRPEAAAKAARIGGQTRHLWNTFDVVCAYRRTASHLRMLRRFHREQSR